MKKRELQELKGKESKELTSLFAKKKQELARVVLEIKSGKIKNVHAKRSLRREIAQITTLMNEKEMERNTP